jgi:16S rRNA (cytosine967-C5)-methyltransferase
MENSGEIRAFDLHENRVRLIGSGAKRLGLDTVKAAVNNAKQFNAELPEADCVLCDVPCSGFGVIRRKPEIKYKELSDFERLPNVQYEILDTSARYVKVGGTLVYSTCTVSRAENDAVAEKFLANHPEFRAEALPEPLGGDYKVTITPDKFNSDGFFIAKFVRTR